MRARPTRGAMLAMNHRDHPSAEDVAAFLAAVDGATPLRKRDRVSIEPPRPSPRPRQRELDEAAVIGEMLHAPLAIDDWLDLGGADSFLRSGLPRTLLRDLRRGRWSIQDHVDLHGMNRHEAHEQVALFIAESLAAGKRCLRIVHGRGHGSPGREAILRQWSRSGSAAARRCWHFCHAPPSDGGDGALWVLLKAGGKAPPCR
jgi:DNA-nicking Smr family endonuclease